MLSNVEPYKGHWCGALTKVTGLKSSNWPELLGNCSVHSPEWLFTLWDVCYSKSTFLHFSLIMSSGEANSLTASSEVLWLLASVCVWPIRSPGKVWKVGEKACDTLSQLPPDGVISWQGLNGHSLHPTDIFNRQSLPGSCCWSLLCLFKLREV